VRAAENVSDLCRGLQGYIIAKEDIAARRCTGAGWQGGDDEATRRRYQAA
jgi:hypothetical protein